MSVIETLSIVEIIADLKAQNREHGLDAKTVADYREAMTEGAKFPPVAVFRSAAGTFLADGFHRYEAARLEAFTSIECDIRTGTLRDAILYAVGANADHGLKRTNADKRRAVMLMLEDDEWSGWSNREIARRCRVDEALVRRMRDDTAVKPQSGERSFVHPKTGKPATMNVAAIGKPAQKPASPPVQGVSGGNVIELAGRLESHLGRGQATAARPSTPSRT
ncbi:hypothetical protein [Microvirga antarctica]|uniref:hypothetical protein n=1 Tax=Microvirga antarctica TaxID=2819233 RepID=UPI001B301211|nr:hypothetical protein [Microvirga antarctica]